MSKGKRISFAKHERLLGEEWQRCCDHFRAHARVLLLRELATNPQNAKAIMEWYERLLGALK